MSWILTISLLYLAAWAIYTLAVRDLLISKILSDLDHLDVQICLRKKDCELDLGSRKALDDLWETTSNLRECVGLLSFSFVFMKLYRDWRNPKSKADETIEVKDAKTRRYQNKVALLIFAALVTNSFFPALIILPVASVALILSLFKMRMMDGLRSWTSYALRFVSNDGQSRNMIMGPC